MSRRVISETPTKETHKNPPTFRPISKDNDTTNRAPIHHNVERRVIGEKKVYKNVPIYETIETHEQEIPMECHIDVSRPKINVLETVKEIKKEFPLIEERTQDIPQPLVYADRIVEVPTTVTLMKPTYKREVRERIREVPKIIEKTIDRVVEVPEIKYVYKFEKGPDLSMATPRLTPHTSPLNYPPNDIYTEIDEFNSPYFYNPDPQYESLYPSHNYPSPSLYSDSPNGPIVDIDVPIPYPVPVVVDIPVEVSLERHIPKPVVVGKRYHPVYKNSGDVKRVEIFVPKPRYVQQSTCPDSKPHIGHSRVIGFHTLHDKQYHQLPYPNDPTQLPPSFQAYTGADTSVYYPALPIQTRHPYEYDVPLHYPPLLQQVPPGPFWDPSISRSSQDSVYYHGPRPPFPVPEWPSPFG